MKQTILSKCFGKMKRVALTLFAALCVGSVWAEEGEGTEVTYVTTPMEDPSAGYIRTGLGTDGNEVAVVFTNHTKTATWTVPYNLYNVEFLVVGGGGGGGADSRSGDASTGGGGGGGGGVVTGLVNFVKGECLTIKVGAGGQGGTPGQSPSNWSGHYGASYGGEASQFSINDLEMYVKANGGGRDQGVSSDGSSYKNYTFYQGGVGGSNAGSRGNCKTEQSNAIAGERLDAANRLVAIDLTLANKGGNGESGSIDYYGYPAAGGGGGALTPGCDGESHYQGSWAEQNYWYGGDGGKGLPSSITGELRVYGSGGGGASTQGGKIASGGDGAGDGGSRDNGGQGANALANQGGGGGGSSRTVAKGGNGGSGIVVLRYRKVIQSSDVQNSITPVRWTGEDLYANIVETESYTVSCEPKKDIGQNYELTVTPKQGWAWEDNATESKVFYWEIIKAENEWDKAPVLSASSWIVGETDKIALTPLRELQLKYNRDISVTISENGGESKNFNGNLPTDIGRYTLTYTAPGGDTYNAFVYSINFAINDNPTVQMLPDSIGYKHLGLGLNNDEVAVVFTKSGNWTVPADLEKIEFLVVGGGGGGGADSHWDDSMGGAGGGGGGVVTGVVKKLTVGTSLSVTVGGGGVGGSKSSGNPRGSSGNGGDSELKVANVSYVKAIGGGGDGGASSDNVMTGNIGKDGGSSGGSRAGQASVGNVKHAIINRNGVLLCYKEYGHSGGAGNTSTQNYYGHKTAAGGGGGAMHDGYPAEGTRGGNGGEGLMCAITGQVLDYGSGGGGASIAYTGGYAGGEGAGDARTAERPENSGENALPNRGGGGGGGCRTGGKEGGDGGSGIVVIRYKTTIHTVELPEIDNATWYNGANPVTEFKVEEGTTISLTLKAADGYFFEDGTGEMVFNVGQNGTSGEAPQYRPAVAKIGDVKYSLLSAALDNATAGAEIELVAESLELSDNMTIGKNVTLNLGNNTLTIPDDKTVTVNKGVALTIKCGTGGLVVDGDIAVNGTLDISGLSYGATGLIANKAGSLKIGATGIVKLMNAWKTISPNWMMANNTSFFNGTAAGAKLIQEVTTNTFTSGVWVKPTNVAITTINSNGLSYLEGFDTLEDAFENAVISDEVNNEVKLHADIEATDVITVPQGVTLNLNGKSIQALAVVGKLAMNGGALKTYDTNTQTYFFMAAPAETAGALYWTTDAVMTIERNYDLSLDGGSVTLPKSWRSLLKQSLTIKSNATFVIPQGVELNLRGNAVVEEGATLTCDGTIALGNTYDAVDTSATLSGVELDEGKVTSAVEGYKVQYTAADVKYTLVTEGLDVTIGDDTFDTVEELIAAANTTKTMTVTGNDWRAEGNVLKKGDDAYVTFADYYTVVVDGTTVTLTLNDTVKPVISDSTEGADDAFTVSAKEVTIKIKNYNSALKYAVRSAADIKDIDNANATIQPVEVKNGAMTVSKSGDRQFYKVVVSDVDFSEAK